MLVLLLLLQREVVLLLLGLPSEAMLVEEGLCVDTLNRHHYARLCVYV